MVSLVPTVLATSEEEYQKKVSDINQSQEFGGAWVQVDLMDGKFVPNTTVGLDIVARHPFNKDIKKEAHLMVEKPQNWIEELKNLGFKRIMFPIEVGNIEEIINQIKEAGLEVGLALNPETPVAKIGPFVSKMDVVLLMSVHPGFGGQQFIPEVLSKVREAENLQGENHFLIEVDGGVNEGDEKQLIEAGANNLVIGERLINGDIKQNLAKLRQKL